MFRSETRRPLLNLLRNISIFKLRIMSNALGSIKSVCEGKFLEGEIEEGSNVQTMFLIKNLYFNALALHVRELRPYKKYLMAKYFKTLKSNKYNKNKRELQNIIGIIV
jgi:hypothetical protein